MAKGRMDTIKDRVKTIFSKRPQLLTNPTTVVEVKSGTDVMDITTKLDKHYDERDMWGYKDNPRELYVNNEVIGSKEFQT